MAHFKRFAKIIFSHRILIIAFNFLALASIAQSSREKISINKGWRFIKGDPTDAIGLMYDVRPEITDRNDNVVADAKPTESVKTNSTENVFKKWILPTANDFIKDPSKHHQLPESDPGNKISYVQNNFNDSGWEIVNLPHDLAINGPFY
jgi:beta-galactosidase